MTSTHLTIVGKGKDKIIQTIIHGNGVHPSLPSLTRENKRMKINKTVFTYNKQFKPFNIFKNYKYNKKAFIFIDTEYDINIHTIQQYYDHLLDKHNHSDIHLLLYQDKGKNNTATIDLKLFHHIIQFCSFKQIKLININ